MRPASLQEAVFDEYRISSQNNDRIAFMVDLALLCRALKSSVSMDGDKLQMKLVKKRPSLTERPMPYLTFESKVCCFVSRLLSMCTWIRFQQQ